MTTPALTGPATPQPISFHLADPETLLITGDWLDFERDDWVADLIIWDPPYNLGHSYPDYPDDQPEHVYLRWLTQCFTPAVAHNLQPNGSFWVVLPPKFAWWLVREALGLGLRTVNQIVWHYRFGQHTPHRFIPSHTSLLWLCREDATPTFNLDVVAVPSDRLSTYNDKRTAASPRKGLRAPLDVWHYPRIQGNNKERRPAHPNQLPELLVARIIKACSNPGDLVLDPMCGSGTVPTVARALSRRSVSVDISREAIQSTHERVVTGPVRDVVNAT